jgi:hypothetical protein
MVMSRGVARASGMFRDNLCRIGAVIRKARGAAGTS